MGVSKGLLFAAQVAKELPALKAQEKPLLY